jgi:hypothetical protein
MDIGNMKGGNVFNQTEINLYAKKKVKALQK